MCYLGMDSYSWIRILLIDTHFFIVSSNGPCNTRMPFSTIYRTHRKGYQWGSCQLVSNKAQLTPIWFPWEGLSLAAYTVLLDRETITLDTILEIFPILKGIREPTPVPEGTVLPNVTSTWGCLIPTDGRPTRNWCISGARPGGQRRYRSVSDKATLNTLI